MPISLEGTGFSTSVLEWTFPKDGDSYLEDFGMTFASALASFSPATERGGSQRYSVQVCREDEVN